MTPEELDHLEALANAATPGPWQSYIAYSGELGVPNEVGIYAGAQTTHSDLNTIISDFGFRSENMLPDLDFIAAASPDVILRLIARARLTSGDPA